MWLLKCNRTRQNVEGNNIWGQAPVDYLFSHWFCAIDLKKQWCSVIASPGNVFLSTLRLLLTKPNHRKYVGGIKCVVKWTASTARGRLRTHTHTVMQAKRKSKHKEEKNIAGAVWWQLTPANCITKTSSTIIFPVLWHSLEASGASSAPAKSQDSLKVTRENNMALGYNYGPYFTPATPWLSHHLAGGAST